MTEPPIPRIDVGSFDRVDTSASASTFAEWMSHQRRHGPDRAIELLDLDESSRVLDLGCGAGTDLSRLAEVSPLAIGVDRSRVMAAASERAVADTTAQLLVADGLALPFAENTFDAAWVRAVLIHVPDPAFVMAEVARVLRAGGRVVLSEPDHGTHIVACSCADVFERIRAHRRFSFRNPLVGRQLPDVASRAGLKVTKAWATPIVHRSYDHALAAGGPFGVAVEAAVDAGAITAAEADEYEASLRDHDERGAFLFIGVAVSIAAVAPT